MGRAEAYQEEGQVEDGRKRGLSGWNVSGMEKRKKGGRMMGGESKGEFGMAPQRTVGREEGGSEGGRKEERD